MKYKHVTGMRANIIHRDELGYRHANTKRRRLLEEQPKHFDFQNFGLTEN